MQNKNKIILSFILAAGGIIVVFFLSINFHKALAENNFVSKNIVVGEFIVKLNKSWNNSKENINKIENFFKKFGITIDSLGDGQSETLKNRLLVKLGDTKKSEMFFKAAKEFTLIDSVSPNYIYQPLFVPNDPLYSKQWNFEKIKISQAWDEDQREPLYGGDPAVLCRRQI